jgi:hypothetical protein
MFLVNSVPPVKIGRHLVPGQSLSSYAESGSPADFRTPHTAVVETEALRHYLLVVLANSMHNHVQIVASLQGRDTCCRRCRTWQCAFGSLIDRGATYEKCSPSYRGMIGRCESLLACGRSHTGCKIRRLGDTVCHLSWRSPKALPDVVSPFSEPNPIANRCAVGLEGFLWLCRYSAWLHGCFIFGVIHESAQFFAPLCSEETS